GVWVALGLCVDQKTTRSINAAGPSLSGVVKAVDAEKSTVTLADTQWRPGSGKDLPADGGESTFPVAKDASIVIDGKPGKLAGLPLGTQVTLSMGLDRKTARGISAEGLQPPGGLVKAVDAEKGTITLDDDKAPPDLAGKTFPVARDADI